MTVWFEVAPPRIMATCNRARQPCCYIPIYSTFRTSGSKYHYMFGVAFTVYSTLYQYKYADCAAKTELIAASVQWNTAHCLITDVYTLRTVFSSAYISPERKQLRDHAENWDSLFCGNMPGKVSASPKNCLGCRGTHRIPHTVPTAYRIQYPQHTAYRIQYPQHTAYRILGSQKKKGHSRRGKKMRRPPAPSFVVAPQGRTREHVHPCLLYTSDAADE